MTTRADRRRGERGTATLLVVPAALAICAGCLAGVSRIGVAATGLARADAVADLSALAAVTGGVDAATDVAAANGARTLGVTTSGAVRTVRVRVDGIVASASAAPSVGGRG